MKAVKLHSRILHITEDEERAQNWIDKAICKDGMIYTFYHGSSMPVSPEELVIVDYDNSVCHKCGKEDVENAVCPTCLHWHAENEAWEYGVISRDTGMRRKR